MAASSEDLLDLRDNGLSQDKAYLRKCNQLPKKYAIKKDIYDVSEDAIRWPEIGKLDLGNQYARNMSFGLRDKDEFRQKMLYSPTL